MRRILLLASVFCLLASGFQPAKRSSSARRQFARANPCPATGKPVLPCPGYVIDHIWPLCAGGRDIPANMQWQTARESYSKDRWERRLCREMAEDEKKAGGRK